MEEIIRATPFIIAIKYLGIKWLGINLTQNTKDFYNENNSEKFLKGTR